MSEGTITPGMEHHNYLPEKPILEAKSTSPVAGTPGINKRKWSPDRSDSSTATLMNQHETRPRSGTASPSGNDSPRTSKRAKLNQDIPTKIQPAAVEENLPSDRSQLPVEMWQSIFTYVPPNTLGRLMRVNKIFQTLLTPNSPLPAPQLVPGGRLKLIQQESLWSVSRRTFFPGMPRPLFSQSELEAWKLTRGRGCEFCGKRNTPRLPPVPTSPWTAGPGTDHVRVIWPFAVRSCGNCLRARMQKETDLLFSAFSALLPALPFAFFTPSFDYVASITLRSEPPPRGLQLTKWYFAPQVEEMKARLKEVKDLGEATAEEWFKGLEVDGREKAADAVRWEQWESVGGFQAISRRNLDNRHPQNLDLDLYRHHPSNSEEQSTSGVGTVKDNGYSSIGPVTIAQSHPWTNQAPPPTLPAKPANPISAYASGYPGTSSNFSLQAPKPHLRVERSIHDVNEKKSARRAEIERRCAELDPPIQPATLAFMDSFAAALQIAMPLTDQAWELLKPRLLAQREAAEQQECEQLAQNRFVIQQTEERKQQEAQLKEAKETLDREWDDSQKSVREKLETYADTFIREQWQDGDAVTKESCAQFAADMLLHVRHRFYTSLAQEDGRMRSWGIPILTDSSHPGTNRKLTLENMRWLYENKVKPLTERFQKELFLCNACDNHGRYYSLDSVVQHFAAKHTDSLSMGTAVVYWKADWPELPPFDPNPTAAKASLYVSANPSPALSSGQLMYSGPPAFHGHGPGSYVSADPTTYSASLSGQGAYRRPPQRFEDALSTYVEASSSRNMLPQMARPISQILQYPPTPTNPPIQRYGLHHPPDCHDWRRQQVPNNPVASYQNQFTTAYPGQTAEFGARPGSALSYVSHAPSYPSFPPSSHPFGRPQPPPGVRLVPNNLPPGQPMGIYQVQIQELAHNAREIWDGTSGISDMPDSVRVQAIIRHVVLRFKDKYTNEPNLALFTDGLNNNSQMSPMRVLNSLICKACAIVGRMTGGYGDSDIRSREARLYTLPALLAHFQSAHIEHAQPTAISSMGMEMPRLDWKFDMVEMPEEIVVQNLMYSPGMTQAKLHLISSVLPHYFPSPLPQVDPVPYDDNHDATIVGSGVRKIPEHSDFYETNATASKAPFDENNSSAGQFRQFTRQRRETDPERSAYRSRDTPKPHGSKQTEAVGEDEYDPHRPAYVNSSTTEKPSAERSEYPDYRSRHIHQAVPIHGTVNDPFIHHNVEAISRNHRTSSGTGYSVLTPTQPPFRRSTDNAHESLGRTMSRLEPDSHWDNLGSQPSPMDRRVTPLSEPLNAAEQFLQSFDLGPDIPLERNQVSPAIGSLKRPEYDVDVAEDSGYRPRDSDRTWLSDRSKAKPVEYTRVSSPSNPNSALDRYEMADDAMVKPYRARQYDDPYNGRFGDVQTRTHRSLAASPDNQALLKARASHLTPHLSAVRDSPSRRSNSRFERYNAQRQGSQRPSSRSPGIATEPLSVDDTVYHHPSSKQRPAPLPINATLAEERYRDYPYADEVMYRRAPQTAQQIRYIDNPRFLERTYDRPVEYVRVAPRDSQVAGDYYIQRAATHDAAEEYVGYEPTRPHEEVFERHGHLYTRSSSSPQDHHDPFARHVTYE